MSKKNNTARVVTSHTKPAALPAKKEPVVKEVEEMMIDDTEAEDVVEKKGSKRSQKALMVIRMKGIVRKLAQLEQFARETPALRMRATEAHMAAEALKTEVLALPADWQRARKGKMSAQDFAVGQIVAVSEAFKNKYAELISAEEMDDLRVLKKATLKNGTSVYSVKTSDGARLFISAAHLRNTEG